MRRRRTSQDSEAEVPLSPLIDCVFLMLIFFLVTSMIKRWERQIPTRMQQDASKIERGELNKEIELGIDTEGRLYTIRGRSRMGLKSSPAGETRPYLVKLASEIPRDTPITLIAEEQIPFQKFIQVLDEFEIQGFSKVRARSSDILYTGHVGERSEKGQRQGRF